MQDKFETLSQINHDLNEPSGTHFTEEDRAFIEQLEANLAGNEALETAAPVNNPGQCPITFDHVVRDKLRQMTDTTFKFCRRAPDDPEFARIFLDCLFSRYLKKGVA